MSLDGLQEGIDQIHKEISESRYVFGVDPDSKAHGVAVYRNKKLEQLVELPTPELIKEARKFISFGAQLLFSVEHVNCNGFIYAQQWRKELGAQGKVGMSVGKCQQAQIELCRWLDFYDIHYELHAPVKGNWADTKLKPQFSKVTGWKSTSNADTRSAAFFGYLEINRKAGNVSPRSKLMAESL